MKYKSWLYSTKKEARKAAYLFAKEERLKKNDAHTRESSIFQEFEVEVTYPTQEAMYKDIPCGYDNFRSFGGMTATFVFAWIVFAWRRT